MSKPPDEPQKQPPSLSQAEVVPRFRQQDNPDMHRLLETEGAPRGNQEVDSGNWATASEHEYAGPNVGSVLRHYELIRELGRGGMGTVFLARDTRLGRLVAVKVMSGGGRKSAMRFITEARATAHCRHDNIVTIYEVDEHNGHPYMVLEYLEGQTLRTWLKNRRPSTLAATERTPVPVGLAVQLVLPIARALACAHEQGIVHRDLKPENIMLTDAGTQIPLWSAAPNLHVALRRLNGIFC